MAKAHTLVDNFNDNAQDTARWLSSTGDRLSEVNERVEIRPIGNTAQAFYNYRSLTTYDLTDSEFRIELVRAPFGIYGAGAYLQATLGSGDRVQFQVTGGNLNADIVISNTTTKLARIPYDPVAHRWLRIREAFGTVYWEVSADGTVWHVVASRSPHPITLTAVYALFGGGTLVAVPAPGVVVFDNFNVQDTGRARRLDERRLSARDVRVQAAQLAAERNHEEHANNNDEVNYPDLPFIGSYSKSLRHNAVGDPEPISYGTMLRALESRDPADFDEIILASSTALKFTNPQAGLAFDLEGPDAQAYTLPPAPRFDSAVAAHEMGELYWMAVARDIHFADYTATTPPADITAAIGSLNNEFPQFGGTTPVTGKNLFRGVYPGEQIGPYVSQFLLKGNNDPRRPDGLGRDANEGFISYGARVIDQRLIPAAAGTDYLKTHAEWLAAQNGVDERGDDVFDTTRRFIRNLRDGATFVHFDQVIDAFYNAAWILMSEPTGNQLTFQAGITGRPQIDQEFQNDQGNPYNPPGTPGDSRTQAGFATFGPIHLLQVLSEVVGRALRATWWQKWGVHRRLRPEEYGGRVDNLLAGRGDYPLHFSITDSMLTGALAPYFGNLGERFPQSYLLPQAYPEGAPTHPAYGAGHATGAGACATILKAFFDESTTIENPVVANSLGTALVSYVAPAGEPAMNVGGELNKLAGNIALFRNAAGVHWRSDYTESLPFGEAIAIGLLQEMSLGFNEDDAFFELTKFDGQKIRIFDGKVEPVIV
ncbi:MAG TPA: hypothetical protein VGC13_17980 [Longimicrobium sp.]|jgi:hypothetical protein|uniref:hypothetical protein n=1 Tax=Longimicrobium sp. TaxID=2029185 RepID=UPI002EDB4EE5